MKVIYVTGPDDFGAMDFEDKFGKNPSIKLWNQIKHDGFLVTEVNGEEVDFDVEALEFGEVDQNFVGFISTMIDYDFSKSINFFVVKED